MQVMILHKNIMLLSVILSAVTMVGVLYITGTTATAATVSTCDDRTTIIPDTFRGDADVFCADRGGHSGVSMSACEDRATIIPSGFRGDPDVYCADHGGFVAPTSNNEGTTFSGGEQKLVKSDCKDAEVNQENCGIIRYLVLFINILSALVGVVVVGSIIYGGIQYSTAGSDPQKVSAAKSRIRNAIIALVFFIFTYSLLNYLVPGGVL